MDDQRVEARPSLGREDRGDGALVGRVGAEPIDGLGRKGDERPVAQQPRGARDRRADAGTILAVIGATLARGPVGATPAWKPATEIPALTFLRPL